MHVTDARWVFLYVYVYIHDLAIESYYIYFNILFLSFFILGLLIIFYGIQLIFEVEKKFYSWNLVPKSELTNYFYKYYQEIMELFIK
jgi:hypothetical protein